MKYLLILLLVIACKDTSQNTAKSQDTETVYYLIRHAEKERTKGIGYADPKLSERGLKRAQEWISILKDKGITMIYSSDYNRTRLTAQPLAETLGLDIQYYNISNPINDTFKEATKGQIVLIVGHSNTTPAFVNAIVGTKNFKDIDDRNNGALYKVIVKNGKTSVTLKQYEDGF